jgi:hypothetical protein
LLSSQVEEAAHAVPLLVPLAVPVRRAVDHPGALRGVSCAQARVARDAGLARVLHEVVLALLPGSASAGLDGAVAQRLALVGDHQPEVDPDHAAEAAAGLAGAQAELKLNSAGCGSA